MMGILLSAMAGAGDAGVQSMNQNIAQLNALDLEKQRSDLAEQKARSLAQFTNQLSIDSANQQRQAQADRIAGAQGGIINGVLAQKYADADAAAAGQTDAPLTPEQQAVVDAARAKDASALQADPHTYVKAAMATGDLDPKTVASLTDKTDMAQMRAEQFAQRTEMMQQVAEIRAKATTDAMQLRLEAAQQKALNGKIDTATGRMLITSEDANIKAATTQIQLLTRQLGDLSPKDKDGRAAIQTQLDEAKESIKTSQATKNLYMKQLGYPTADDVKPSGAPAAAPSVANPVAPAKPFNPADFMSGGAAPARAAPASPAPAQSAAPAAMPAAAPAAAPVVAARDKDAYYAKDDPVVAELDRSISRLVRTDPSNTQAFQSLVAAKNQRLGQLRANFGNNLVE